MDGELRMDGKLGRKRMNGYGAVITLDCLIINEAPEDNDERCIEFGKKIAAL